MLSDCFPDPNGGSRAARAWRLLCCAASTHRVSLSVSAGGAVNLDQWRRVAGLAKRVHIESGRLRLFGSSQAPAIWETWAQKRRFDVLLATSPGVWPSPSPVDARVQLCDFANANDRSGHGVVEQMGLLGRLTRTALGRRQTLKSVAEIIAECDHPLVATARQAVELPAGQSRAVLIPGSGEMNAWARMFQKANALADFVTPEVTVMPIQPVPSRKAA